LRGSPDQVDNGSGPGSGCDQNRERDSGNPSGGSHHLKKRHAAQSTSDDLEMPKPARLRKRKSPTRGSAVPSIPEAVANANAQMLLADATQGGARESAKAMSEAMSAKANTILLAAADQPAEPPAAAESGVVAADQLNDVDRALQQPASGQPPPAQTVAMAQAKPAQQAQASDSLDKTSLIGKTSSPAAPC
jgi:hypothetical protein